MKYLLPFILCLTGCYHHTWNDAPATPKEDHIPIIIARGTDGNVNWTCQTEDLNDKLVWVPCEFQAKEATSGACIKVVFYDEATMKPVVEGRKFCSGPLKAGENKTNYAAFIKENRMALRRCGELLDLCVMLAEPAKP